MKFFPVEVKQGLRPDKWTAQWQVWAFGNTFK